MIKWWKQWRAWTEQRMKDYDQKLVEEVVRILKDDDYYSLESQAKTIINHILHMDRHAKPW